MEEGEASPPCPCAEDCVELLAVEEAMDAEEFVRVRCGCGWCLLAPFLCPLLWPELEEDAPLVRPEEEAEAVPPLVLLFSPALRVPVGVPSPLPGVPPAPASNPFSPAKGRKSAPPALPAPPRKAKSHLRHLHLILLSISAASSFSFLLRSKTLRYRSYPSRNARETLEEKIISPRGLEEGGMGWICRRRRGGSAVGFAGSGASRTRRVVGPPPAREVPEGEAGKSEDLDTAVELTPADAALSIAAEPLDLMKGRDDSQLSPAGGLRVLRYMLKGLSARLACGTKRLAATILSAYMPLAKKRKTVVPHTTSDTSWA